MDYFEFRGTQIPKLGFGTWEIEGDDAVEAVCNALEIGYRHIDTAQAYDNHVEVGQALSRTNIAREDIFLTTKIWLENFEPEELRSSFQRSLERLRTNYVDLLLLHWPNPDVPLDETLEALAQLHAENSARLIGLSNFTTDLMDRAVKKSPVPLAVNQVECHPYLSQAPILGRCRRYEMGLTAYSPLRRGDVLDDEVLASIAEKHGKSAGQVALRWLIQQPRVLAIPKAEDPDHAAENLDIFDFELTEDQMQQVFSLARPDGRKIDPEFAPNWDDAA